MCTFQLIFRYDFIPAIFGVTKNDGPCGVECVVSIPERSFLRFDGTSSQLCDLASQATEHFGLPVIRDFLMALIPGC